MVCVICMLKKPRKQAKLRGGARGASAVIGTSCSVATGFKGIIGVISCNEFGDCGTGRVHVSHHTDSSVTDIAELPIVYRFAP